MISLQCDRVSIPSIYDVQNEFVAAYNELRDEVSQEKLAEELYADLDEEQQDAVRQIYPQKIRN